MAIGNVEECKGEREKGRNVPDTSFRGEKESAACAEDPGDRLFWAKACYGN